MLNIDEKECHRDFGNFIRSKRKALDLKQEDLAERMGVTQGYISYLERGEREVDIAVAVKLCHALHLNIQEFINNYL